MTESSSREVVAFYASCAGSDQKDQGRGLGTALLKHFVLKAMEVSASVGVRLLLVHAKDESAESFYEH